MGDVHVFIADSLLVCIGRASNCVSSLFVGVEGPHHGGVILVGRVEGADAAELDLEVALRAISVDYAS